MELEIQAMKLINAESSWGVWGQLLFLFDDNKNELSNRTKIKIYHRCEQYRREYSTENDPIRREDVNPNIYSDATFLEHSEAKTSLDFTAIPVLRYC